jgi:hypothetical protein
MPKFKVGETVYFRSGPAGAFKITGHMPVSDGGDFQYRLKGADEHTSASRWKESLQSIPQRLMRP